MFPTGEIAERAHFLNRVVDYYLRNGSFCIRKSLFPQAHPSYLDQGANMTFEEFYNGLDSENRVRFVNMVQLNTRCDD